VLRASNESSTDSMRRAIAILLNPHARERLVELGAAEAEAVPTVESGDLAN
jgi:hypothetical protein